MKKQNESMLSKIEAWIEYCFKVENQIIDVLSEQLREFIEKEQKIQNEIRISSF